MLIQVAHQLVAVAGPTATVIRLGGDEFAICYPKPHDIDFPTNEAKRILAILSATGFSALDVQLDVRASIGVALAPYDGTTVDELMQHADVAMYPPSGPAPASSATTRAPTPTRPTGWPCWACCATPWTRATCGSYYQPVIRADGLLAGRASRP